jgi:hypothetical protein
MNEYVVNEPLFDWQLKNNKVFCNYKNVFYLEKWLNLIPNYTFIKIYLKSTNFFLTEIKGYGIDNLEYEAKRWLDAIIYEFDSDKSDFKSALNDFAKMITKEYKGKSFNEYSYEISEKVMRFASKLYRTDFAEFIIDDYVKLKDQQLERYEILNVQFLDRKSI